MVRVWNQAGHNAQDGEGLYLHVRGQSVALGLYAALVERDQRVDLLIDIQIFDEAFSQEVVEVFQAGAQIVYVLLSDLWLALFDDDERPDEPTTVRRNINCILLIIDVYRDKLLDSSALSQRSEVINKLDWLSVNSDWLTVEVYHEVFGRVHLITSNHIGILHPKVNGYFMKGFTWSIRGYMSGQGEVFD